MLYKEISTAAITPLEFQSIETRNILKYFVGASRCWRCLCGGCCFKKEPHQTPTIMDDGIHLKFF